MENLIYIIFICITIPIILMTLLLDSKSKRTLIFFIVGICAAVFASEINGILIRVIRLDEFNFTTRVTPFTEEIIKAAPVLFYATVLSSKRETMMTVSMAVGIGFAVMENTFVIMENIEGVTLTWSVIRGFGTGIMHGMGTFLVGTGFAYAKKNKKIFTALTFALLSLSITYHAVFNMLVQSDYRYVGAALPIITYLPLVIWFYFSRKKRSENK